MKYAWWPHSTDRRTASYRLRCAQIIPHLQSQGLDVGEWQPGMAAPAVLVLAKRYDSGSLATALSMRAAHGTRLMLDLCDNHFHTSMESQVWQRRAADLLQAVMSVDCVITSTETLADVVRQHDPAATVEVIGDAIEEPRIEDGPLGLRVTAARWQRWRLEKALQSGSVACGRRIVWFGNHASGYADGGMADLLSIQQMLEARHAESPLHLTVVSNSRRTFDKVMGDWRVTTHYLPWHIDTISSVLRMHDACVIPIGRNPFTLSKTNNRIATALLHGLNVVADLIPSYLPLAPYIALDNWSGGLTRAICQDLETRRRTEAGAAFVRQEYSLPRIAELWRRLLCTPISQRGTVSFGALESK